MSNVGCLSRFGQVMSVLERETVHTVNEYWDGPRVGVSDSRGNLICFECIFDEAEDDSSSIFWLHSFGAWWVKCAIDIDHEFAWNVVQELGHVLNYVSLDERLPTVFMPVSPPSY